MNQLRDGRLGPETMTGLPLRHQTGRAPDNTFHNADKVAYQVGTQTVEGSVFQGGVHYHGGISGQNQSRHGTSDHSQCDGSPMSFIPSPLNSESRRQKFLEELRFKEFEAREMSIKPAHTHTCQWVDRTVEYREWLDDSNLDNHHGFLWIKGKPGSGKSTIMKYLLTKRAEARSDNQDRSRIDDSLEIAFFFNARGSNLEKSTEGMYRSLLVQLLDRFINLQSVLDRGLLMTIEFLQELLGNAIKRLQNYKVTIFIDALDECNEDEVRQMIRFFESLGDAASKDGRSLRILLSSRHYPHITIKHGASLVVEDRKEHHDDMVNYLSSELRIGDSQLAEDIRERILDKASGVFLWIVLVVLVLNKRYDRGRLFELAQLLETIPNGLHELFNDVLNRDQHQDPQDELEFRSCVQWVLCSMRPITSIELYYGIMTASRPEFSPRQQAEEMQRADVVRFVLACSKGFIEETRPTKPLDEPRMQFIHETVREFFLDYDFTKCGATRAEMECQRHDNLKIQCANYIDKAMLGRKFEPDRLPRQRTHPLLFYAVKEILRHADEAQAMGCDQSNFFISWNRKVWLALYNVFSNRGSDWYSEAYASELYAMVTLSVTNIITIVLPEYNTIDIVGGGSKYPLVKAHRVWDVATVKALLTPSCPLEERFQYYHRDIEETATMLRYGMNVPLHHTPLSWAAAHNFLPVVRCLLATGRCTFEAGLFTTGTPLHWAVVSSYTNVCKLLLAAGACVNAQSSRMESVLYTAVSRGNLEVVDLLLNAGANVDQPTEIYCARSLYAASRWGHKDIVVRLLELGANINSVGGSFGSAVKVAFATKCDDIVALLLEAGADINVGPDRKWKQLIDEARACNRFDIADQVIAAGADVEDTIGIFLAGVKDAINRGDLNDVFSLLDRAPDVRCKGALYASAMTMASAAGKIEMVNLMIAYGADVEFEDDTFTSPLLQAVRAGHIDMTSQLLEAGAKVNSQSGVHGYTVLHQACIVGHLEMVNVLLGRRADVNIRSYDGRIALCMAAESGHTSIVQKLVKQDGVIVDHPGGQHGSPLNCAAFAGHWDAVKALLRANANPNIRTGQRGLTAWESAHAGKQPSVARKILEFQSRPKPS